MRVSLEQVAEKARVSMTTAQRAMRGDDRVRVTTRERVEQMASELGYRPNVAARQLRKQLRQNVGLLIACPDGPGDVTIYLSEYARFIAGLAGLLDQAEHNLLLGTAAELVRQANMDAVLPRIVDGGHVNKLVVLSHMWPEFAGRVRRLRVPTIVVDGPDCGLSCVQMDEAKAAESLTDRFVQLGHRRIAFCNHHGPEQHEAIGYRDALWPAGYFKALTRHQLTPVPGWDEFIVSIGDAVDRMLTLDQPPTAIIAYDDQMAGLFVSEFMKRGISVPGKVSVAGLRYRGIGPFVAPATSHMASPQDEMANIVATMMLEDDQRLLVQPVRQWVQPRLFEGQTMGPASLP